MSDNGSNTGLGLDQLIGKANQGAFTIPKPTEEPIVEEKVIVAKTEEPVDPLKIPIDVSSASARPVETSEDKKEILAPKEIKDASSPFASFANVLKERGIFFDEITEDMEFNSVDDFEKGIEKAIQYNVNQRVTQEMSKYTPETQEFLNMINSGVPLEQVKEVANITVKDLTPDNIENSVDVQKQAVRMYLGQSTDMSEQDINDQIEYLEDTEKLSTKALSYSEKIKTNYDKQKQQLVEKAEADKTANQVAATKQMDDLKSKVFDTAEIIPGRKINDKTKEKIFKSITTSAGKDPHTGQPTTAIGLKRSKDPVAFEITLAYLNELGVFDGKWDSVIASAKSEATKELEKTITNNSGPIGGKSPVYAPEGISDVSKSILDSFKNLKSELNK